MLDPSEQKVGAPAAGAGGIAAPSRVADAAVGNWFDRATPAALRPFGRLARFDRPIGAWLLLFPCWWGQALGEISQGRAYPNLWYLVLFLVGAFVMRGAGCTYNDIIDRDFDAKVERTRNRPLPSGQVTVMQALIFACILSLVGLLVLIQFNTFTIWLAISSLLLVAAYPFAKRLTNWPQLILGFTFKWGALVGFAAATGRLAAPAVLLYAGSILWTIGYDTIYAHQDSRDDAEIGVRSTALRFGAASGAWLSGFYTGAVMLWAAAAVAAGAGWPTFLGLLLVALQLVWQVTTLDTSDAANCLERFKSNRIVGWLFFVGLIVDLVLVQAVGKL